jgi:hypothetical protein
MWGSRAAPHCLWELEKEHYNPCGRRSNLRPQDNFRNHVKCTSLEKHLRQCYILIFWTFGQMAASFESKKQGWVVKLRPVYQFRLSDQRSYSKRDLGYGLKPPDIKTRAKSEFWSSHGGNYAVVFCDATFLYCEYGGTKFLRDASTYLPKRYSSRVRSGTPFRRPYIVQMRSLRFYIPPWILYKCTADKSIGPLKT